MDDWFILKEKKIYEELYKNNNIIVFINKLLKKKYYLSLKKSIFILRYLIIN